jgi:queuine tRNA-ribosyltransferase
LRHLYHAGEILASQIHSLHNLHFYHRLMEKLRAAIREQRLDDFVLEFRIQEPKAGI